MCRHLITAVAWLALLAGTGSFPAQTSQENAGQMDRQSVTHSRKAFLGVLVERAAQGEQGLLVRDVTPNSPAAKAGVRRGDMITKVDDRDIREYEELANVISRHRPGDRLTFEVMRNGRERELTVTLRERPADRSQPLGHDISLLQTIQCANNPQTRPPRRTMCKQRAVQVGGPSTPRA